MDETAAREAHHTAWLWTAVTKDFTLPAIAGSRKADVAQDLGREDFAGIVTSDRDCGYDWVSRPQLCVRRLQECAQQLFHHWHHSGDGTITWQAMKRNIRPMDVNATGTPQPMRLRLGDAVMIGLISGSSNTGCLSGSGSLPASDPLPRRQAGGFSVTVSVTCSGGSNVRWCLV